MRRLLLLAGIAVWATIFAHHASAADMPVKAPPAAPIAPASYNWSGFYVGGQVGYLWGRTRVEEDGVVTEPHAKTNGVIGGVLGGYNWQTGPVVFGLEGDFSWTNAHGTGTVTPPPSPTVITTQLPNTYDVNWTSHVRGRLGYAADRWLFFVAGGLAIADFDFQEGATITTVIPPSPGGTYIGWSIGGGVEYAITQNILGRVEFLYDDFGHKDYIGSDSDPYRVKLTGRTLRGALAWKF
jgi:outer membrane immunogenic protein